VGRICGQSDVEQFQRIATVHITLKGICHSETSPIHLFKNNQWFKTIALKRNEDFTRDGYIVRMVDVHFIGYK